MAKSKLLMTYLKEDRKETELVKRILTQRQERKKAEARLRRALNVDKPVKITSPVAKSDIALSSEDKKDETLTESKSKQGDKVTGFNQTTCVNCGQATPIDSVKCIHCHKNQHRKENHDRDNEN